MYSTFYCKLKAPLASQTESNSQHNCTINFFSAVTKQAIYFLQM